MRSIGCIALEWELRQGDSIYSKMNNGIYTILGQEPHPNHNYKHSLIVSKNGIIFQWDVLKNRNINYPFVLDGIYMILGDQQ
jgi:hypothetical protein